MTNLKPLPSRGETKSCPHCAETIKAEAKVCRFCGKDPTRPYKPPPSPLAYLLTATVLICAVGPLASILLDNVLPFAGCFLLALVIVGAGLVAGHVRLVG